MEDDFTFPLHEKAPSEKHHKGKRNEIISDDKTGFYIRAVPAEKDFRDIARDATIRNAAWKQKQRRTKDFPDGSAIHITGDDIMKKIRVRKKTSLILFVVDLSWSMAVSKRVNATKKAITMILTKAYQYRDDICLITFQKESARLVIPPTHSITLAERAMENIPVGGKTPLASGLNMALEVLKKENRNYGKKNIILILLSDCEGNIPLYPGDEADPQKEALEIAEKIAAEGYRSIVINSDQMSFGQGHANYLAKHLNADCYLISDLNADHLISAVRDELIV